MLTRRNFLKGLLSSVAAAALVKNGVMRPEQVIAEPERWTIDMGANTWRLDYSSLQKSIWISQELLDDIQGLALRPLWPMEGMPPFHVNCRCVIVPVLEMSGLYIKDRLEAWDSPLPKYGEMRFSVPEHVNNSVIDDAFAAVRADRQLAGLPSPYTIIATEVQAHIDELSGYCAQPRGILSKADIDELWGQA